MLKGGGGGFQILFADKMPSFICQCHMRFGNLMHFGPAIQTHGNFGYANNVPKHLNNEVPKRMVKFSMQTGPGTEMFWFIFFRM